MATNMSSQGHLLSANHMQVQLHSTREDRFAIPADEQQHQTVSNATVDSQSFSNSSLEHMKRLHLLKTSTRDEPIVSTGKIFLLLFLFFLRNTDLKH